MSRRHQDSHGEGGKGSFDPVKSSWFYPLLILALLASCRISAPEVTVKPERFWLDQVLNLRAKLGLSSPLDPSIRFVELSMNDDIARRFATDGEYATIASILRTLESLGAKVVAVDIIYAFGLTEDQAHLAETIEEITSRGTTTVVLSTTIERPANEPPYLIRSLPAAGGDRFLEGIVNVAADKNWREYRMVHQFEGGTFPSLALAAFGATRPGPLAPKVVSGGRMEWKAIGTGGKAVTASADESLLFLNLQHSYYDNRVDNENGISSRVWSIEDLETLGSRNQGVSPFHDAIVFFGYDAEVDGKPTTHGDQEPGMLLHGTALNDLLQGTAIRPMPLWVDLLVVLLVALLAALVFSMVKSKRWLILVALAGMVLILSAGCLAVWWFHLLPATIGPAFLWSAAVVLEVGRRWTFEQRERTQRDAMLGFYFSPAVLKQVTKNLDMIRPQENAVAVLLSDLRGFTTLCETQRVERVFELLNRLFAIETDAALRENGSLARFAGDQFLAYWGAPEPAADAADRALRAALEIHRNLRSRREAPGADDLDSWLKIGIGLHSGRGLVGHVGSRSYRDYNIVGDSVNTTARVEGQTKNYAAAILATGEFIAALSQAPANLLVDRVQVKGKARASDLHAVFEECSGELAEGCRLYTIAFDQYVAGDFKLAAEGFTNLENHSSPTIATSARLLAERCLGFVENPPADWDGIYELTSK